jgi:hypothetical protein
MLSSFRLAGIVTVLFAVCGPAGAQELAPPGSEVSVRKIAIDSGLSHTVKYYVKGGSPQLQALVRRVEWSENELSVIEQLQRLKLDTVVSERRITAFRTAQLTNPYFPPGFLPPSLGSGCYTISPLQRAFTGQLAYEATPQAALQMIGFLEQQQTDLDAALKALAPQEKKAAQGPIDDLRARVAALPHDNAPPPLQPQPAAPRLSALAAPAAPQPLALPVNPVAMQPKAVQNRVEVNWNGTWWAAEVVKTDGNRSYIHYIGWANSWDEWVGADRIRVSVATS